MEMINFARCKNSEDFFLLFGFQNRIEKRNYICVSLFCNELQLMSFALAVQRSF